MSHRAFSDINWDIVKQRQLQPVPFKPVLDKYNYILESEYETISNLKHIYGKQRSQDSPKKNYFLGDLSLYKINKEFENF